MAKKKKKNKNRGAVNIYQPGPEFPGLRGRRGSNNKFLQQMMRQSPAYKKAQKTKQGKTDAVFRQIGSYSAGAVQDAARRAGINANATKLSEGQRILEQLRNPTYKSSIKTPTSSSRPAPKPAPARATPPPAPTTPYSEQINQLSSQLMAQAQQQQAQQPDYGAEFQRRFDEQQANFQKMMIQFRNEANERALASEKRFEDMMIAQQQAEARAAAEREEAARQAAISRQTMIANQMRAASAAPQLKFGSTEPGTGAYGTRPFKRRSDLVSSVAQGITNRLGTMSGGINV
jgi:hypothetical protein